MQIPDAVVAYFRGRCWSSLGYFEAAVAFFDYAAQLAPENENYAYLALDALVRSARIAEALERANAALALDANLPPEEQLSSLTVGGYVVKGLCYEHLEQPAEAKQAYTAALTVAPDAEAALTARGLSLLSDDPAAALRDFERAVKTGTPLLWPYLYLAHDALESGEFRRCLDLAEHALARTRAPVLRANLMEWMAIASIEVAPRSKTSIALMQDAHTVNPLSERIAANVRDLLAGKPPDGLRVANDTSPRAAMEGFRRELQQTG